MSMLLNREMHKISGRVTELKECGQATATDKVREGGAVVVLISDTPVTLSPDDLVENSLDEAETEEEESNPA